MKHAAIVSRSNRWDEADKVTWGEKKIDDVSGVDRTVLSYLNPILERLVQAKEPLTKRVESQFIQADLGGNFLFQEDPKELLVVIDLTLYWRPARYAGAIVVADALTWSSKSRELIQYYGTDGLRGGCL